MQSYLLLELWSRVVQTKWHLSVRIFFQQICIFSTELVFLTYRRRWLYRSLKWQLTRIFRWWKLNIYLRSLDYHTNQKHAQDLEEVWYQLAFLTKRTPQLSFVQFKDISLRFTFRYVWQCTDVFCFSKTSRSISRSNREVFESQGFVLCMLFHTDVTFRQLIKIIYLVIFKLY